MAEPPETVEQLTAEEAAREMWDEWVRTLPIAREGCLSIALFARHLRAFAEASRSPITAAEANPPETVEQLTRQAQLLIATARVTEMRALLERVACAADLEQLAALNAAARKLLGEIDAKEGTEP